jgi:pilus assembly protein CpaF
MSSPCRICFIWKFGEDEKGKLITRQRSSGLRPKFYDNARQFGVEQLVLDAMEEAYG